MALFSIVCIDKPGALAARMAAREAHLVYMSSLADAVRVAGPFLNDAGEMIGSLLILDLADRAAAEAFTANDPYGLAGVFERVDIYPFKVTRGSLG